MKKILLVLLTLGCCIINLKNVNAQAPPQGVNYQAVARNNAGAILPNQALTVRDGIISTAPNGTLQWQETHSVTTNTFGLFNIILGQGTTTGAGALSSFSLISWGASTMFLKVEINNGAGFLE